MNGIQNTKVTSTPVPIHMTAKDLCARVARPSGRTSRITVKYAVTQCCVRTARYSCRCHLSSIFKFPGTLIKSSPSPQYIPGTASPTPTAVASLTPGPKAGSVSLLSSVSIAPSPVSLNLLPYSHRRFEFSRQHGNQQQPQGKGAAAAGPGHRQASFSFAPAFQWQRLTSAVAGIDTFAHSPGASRRGQRGGSA